jgi:hypothetical protein
MSEDGILLRVRSDAGVRDRVACLGYLPIEDSGAWSRGGLPPPLRKQLSATGSSLSGCTRHDSDGQLEADCQQEPRDEGVGGGGGGGSALEAVHLHVLSATAAGARRMLAVRDRLRRDAMETERYNELQLAGARGELSPDAFERARQAFFAQAAGEDCGRGPGETGGDCNGGGGGDRDPEESLCFPPAASERDSEAKEAAKEEQSR